MLTKEYISSTVSIRIVEHHCAGNEPLQNLNKGKEHADLVGPLFEFAGNIPATFAERFPRLMVFAVAAALILTAIAVEVECLRGAGYYWP